MGVLAQAQFTIIDFNDAISLAIETPDGTTFQGNSGNPKTINVKLRRAGQDIINGATTRWFFNGVENTPLANLTSLEIYPADVKSNLTVKVIVAYQGSTYEDSVTMLDLDDVYQVTIVGEDKIKSASETVTLTARVFRGATEVLNGFRCRWSDISGVTPIILYEGTNTTTDRKLTITLTPAQINKKIDILCEISVDTVEQDLELVEETYTPSYDSKSYATAMSVAMS